MAYQKTLITHIKDSDLTGDGDKLVTANTGDSLTTNVPLLYDADGNVISTATRTGNTTKFVTHDAGGSTSGNVPVYDANGNLTDSGSPPGGGAGGDVPWVTPWTEPDAGDFTITNDSGSGGAFDSSGQGIFFYDAPNTGGLHMAVQSAPSTPYTITCAVLPMMITHGGAEFGIGWRNASAQTKHTMRFRLAGQWGIASTKWSSSDAATDYAALDPGWANPSGHLIWFQINDDGSANRTVYVGWDGEFWQGQTAVNTFFHQVSRTDFLTPDQVFFFIDSSSATFGCGIKVVNWTIA